MDFDLIEITKSTGDNPINPIDGIYLSLRNDLKDADITTIIPAKGRHGQLRATIDSLRDSIAITPDYKVSIIIVEISVNMEHLNICREKSCSYIWINENSPRFNKCLAHNIGYCFSDSKLLHFHDSDILVNDSFYSNIKNRKIDSISAVHCLRERCVRSLSEGDSNRIMVDGALIKDVISETNPPMPEQIHRKAPGGSIIVGRSLFELIGGFDSHLFDGYSVEDQFFWDKLSSIVEIPSMNDNDLVHIWHEAERSHNNQDHMIPIEAFRKLESRGKYFVIAKHLLFKLKSKVNELQGL